MSTAPAARAAIEIDKPVAVVRAQFFDLDHAIRHRTHHGVNMRWLPSEAPGERRVEAELKLMTRAHVDVFLIEEGEGGAWVKRFVDGPNRGGRFVARFTALSGIGGAPVEGADGKATRVELEAHVGPLGFYAGLGKLSQLGLQKALEKTLEEHRRAILGYEPGRARGAVTAVIAPMVPAVQAARQKAEGQNLRAVMTNLLEAACIVAVASGEADDAERDVIREVARQLCDLELDRAAVDKMVEGVAAAAAAEGIEQRCDKIAGRLAALDLGEVGLGVATLVAQVSHGVDAPELAVLGRLAAALGVGEAALTDVIHRVDRGLSGAPT
jgi:tellurite resistance protein